MTAAVYAARKLMDTVLISKDIGGQVLWTAGIENYMGYHHVDGPELMRNFHEQMSQFRLEQVIGEPAEKLRRIRGGFQVSAGGRAYEAQAVLIATGKSPRRLQVPGEMEFLGRGVSYCAICDAPLFVGEKVAVIGGGNSALEAVDDLKKIAKCVHLIAKYPLTADEILVERVKQAQNVNLLLEHEIISIEGDGQVRATHVRHSGTRQESELDVAGVFVEIGLTPNSDIVRGLVKLNEAGEIMLNCCCVTSVPGLFAAGDVTEIPHKQIIVAAGEGAKAALQAYAYVRHTP